MKNQALLFFVTLLLIFCNSSSAQVTITLNTSSRTISDFYGLNGANTLVANSSYYDQDVRSGILQANPSYLRYPGGTTANFWDWQEGWFQEILKIKAQHRC